MTRSVCDFCCNPIELARSNDSFKAALLQVLCAINTNTEATAEGMQVVTACLEVTSAGAWGAIGDRITETRFYQTNPLPPTLVGTIYFNEDTQAVVTGVTSGNTQPCPGSDIGESCTNPTFGQLCATATGVTSPVRSEDTAFAAADAVMMVGAVINENFVQFSLTQGDCSPLSVNTYGTLFTDINAGGISSALLNGSIVKQGHSGTGYSGFSAGSIAFATGNEALTTRSATADKYIPLAVDRAGVLLDTPIYNANIGSTGISPIRLEDQAFGASEAVVMAGAVNNRNLGTFNSTNGDVTPLAVGDTGAQLCIPIYDSSIAGAGAVRLEDQAFGNAEAVMMAGQQRQDTPVNNTGTDGDVAPLKCNIVGAQWVRPQTATITSAGGSAASAGNNTLVVAGTNKLKVAKFSLTTQSTAGVLCIFQSGAGGTELWRVQLQAITGSSTGANLAVPAPDFIFATASATLLNLNLSAAETVHWSVSYVDEI